MTEIYSPYEHVGPQESNQKALNLMHEVAAFGNKNNHLPAADIAVRLANETGTKIPNVPTSSPRRRNPQS